MWYSRRFSKFRRGFLASACLFVLAAGGCLNSGGSDSLPQDDNQSSGAGDYAAAFLSDSAYDELLVEVDWVTGHEPSADALDGLIATLTEFCRKPGGIRLVLDDEIPAGGSPAWSVGAVNALEVEWRDSYRDAGARSSVMYFVYVDGHSDRDSDNSKILAYAYHGSSVAMFHETIESVDPGIPLFAEIEDTVLLHEAGHLLGLVGNGIRMVEDHEDSAHGNHDSNDECIMYWALETGDIVDVLLQRKPDFDAACRADMVAAGGAVAE